MNIFRMWLAPLAGWTGYAVVALVAALLAGGAAWKWQANAYEREIADIERQHATAQAGAADAAKELANRYRALERGAVEALNVLAHNLQEARDRAQSETDARATAIRAGALRLSIAVRSCQNGAGGAAADSATAAGDRPQARAELEPEVGIALERIAADGDDAIRAHGACVDAYEEMSDRLSKASISSAAGAP